MSSAERCESDNNSADVLSEAPEAKAPVPCLDDISPDIYGPNTIVIIREHVCQFLYKEEHGPHVFFDTATRKPLPLHTSEILALMESKEYVRPGGDTPCSEAPAELDEVGRQYLRLAFGSINETPRKAGATRFLYVGHFVSKILSASAEGILFSKNKENAQIVVEEVDAAIEEKNKQLPRSEQIVPPAHRQPRTVLSWLERETERGLGPVGQVHLNALKHHDRKLPEQVFDTIGKTIQEVVKVSGKIGPKKVYDLVCGKIRESNCRIEAAPKHEI